MRIVAKCCLGIFFGMPLTSITSQLYSSLIAYLKKLKKVKDVIETFKKYRKEHTFHIMIFVGCCNTSQVRTHTANKWMCNPLSHYLPLYSLLVNRPISFQNWYLCAAVTYSWQSHQYYQNGHNRRTRIPEYTSSKMRLLSDQWSRSVPQRSEAVTVGTRMAWPWDIVWLSQIYWNALSWKMSEEKKRYYMRARKRRARRNGILFNLAFLLFFVFM